MTAEYWQRRNEEMKHIQSQFNTDASYNEELKRIYRLSEREIDKEIQAFMSRYASSENVSMDIARERVSKMDVEAFQDKAKQYVKEKNFSPQANEELKRYNLRMKTSRLELLNEHIRLETIALANDEEKLLTARLDEEVYKEFERQAGILGQTVPSQATLRRNAKQIVTADFKGTNFSNRIWTNQHELQNELETVIRRTIIRGENPRVASRELQKLVKENVGNKRHAAERLAITESGRVQTESQRASFEEYEIEQYEYIAEPDACEICSELDGELFNVADMQAGENANPMHPNCRCSVSSVVDRTAFEANLTARGL